MTGLPHGRFTDYFKALNGYGPFRWQSELARRFCDGRYPQALALPTAAGKTACIDIAVFAMAHQADWPAERRTAPRRIFFVVDRRIIVDAAFARAHVIAKKLNDADNGILRDVADALRRVGGDHAPTADKSSDAVPLAVFQLRGGIYRDDAWARTPTQPTVICSTVDQIGSRLLFRSYGNSPHCWPLHAGLAGNDVLIILDEAHCAVPFMQTLEAVRRYREWSKTPVRSPFHVVVMSATPPAGLTDVYPARSEREDVLKDDLLRQRRGAAKPARLRIAAKPAIPRKGQPGLRHIRDNDLLVLDAADQALRWMDDGHDRVAIMVNRVMTAKRIFEALTENNGDARADVVLLTGRMRPIDRASLEGAWTPRLRANNPEQLDRPVIVVTTQCLEVGADFSFDALVTECVVRSLVAAFRA
ncbi:MAG: type I-U CRISPR-associated helicase/endonuclease Cas3, partial [Phycisphaerae bacterium]